MKKLIFILLLIGCEKDCYHCVTTSKSYIGTTEIRGSEKIDEICDKTLEEILKIEKERTTTVYTKEGQWTVRTESKCDCR